MAKDLFQQVNIVLNSYDISADVHGGKVMVGRRKPVDLTGLSDTYDQLATPNIRRWAVKLDFFTNYTGTSAATPGISTALLTVFNSSQTSGVTITWKKTTGLQGVSNPTWTGQVQLDGDYEATAGDVAEADKGSVSLIGLGNLSFLTSSS